MHLMKPIKFSSLLMGLSSNHEVLLFRNQKKALLMTLKLLLTVTMAISTLLQYLKFYRNPKSNFLNIFIISILLGLCFKKNVIKKKINVIKPRPQRK